MKTIAKVLFLFIVCDRLVGLALKYIHKNTPGDTNPYSEIYYSNVNHDVLFIGTSRTRFNINTPLFTKRTNNSSYNLGCENCDIYQQIFMLQEYLRTGKKPKAIFLEIGPWTISQKGVFKKHLFAPYSDESAFILKILYPNKKSRTFTNISSLKFNRNSANILMDFFQNEQKKTLGYEPEQATFYPNNERLVEQLIYDSAKWQAFTDLVRIIRGEKIALYVFTPPYYSWHQQKEITHIWESLLNEYAHEEKYLNFLSDSLFLNNPQLFFDQGHLNKKGAKKFTELLIQNSNI